MKISTLILTVAALGVTAAVSHGQEGDHAGRGPGRAKVLEKFDTDGDGKLDETERKEIRETMKDKVLDRFDTDNDGTLSAAEKGEARAAWAKMKDNHPGLRRAMQMRHRGHGGGKCNAKGGDAPAAE
jgi:hypothetical protein